MTPSMACFRRALAGAALCAGLAALAPLSTGHGGVYRGPGSTFPPGGPGSGSGGGPAGPGLSGGGADYAGDLDSWARWWGFNRDPYLDLKAAIWGAEALTGSDDFFLGRGETRLPGQGRRPSDGELQDGVVPLLLELLRRETSADIRTAALVALAKIGGGLADASGPRIEDTIAGFLGDSNQDVAETAAVALGILGRTNSVFLLANLLGDTASGREAVSAASVDYRTRAFAAFGLGLIGQQSAREDVRRFVVGKLVQALEVDATATEDVQVACVVALGLVPLALENESARASDSALHASTSRQGQWTYLQGLFEDRERDALVRAHVPVSLARLFGASDPLGGAPSAGPDDVPAEWKARAVEAWVRALAPFSKERDEVRGGCVIALGLVGDDDEDEVDVAVRAALARAAEGGPSQARRLALIALGRAASRPGSGPSPGACHADVREQLLEALARQTTTMRPWVGLGLALFERGVRAAGAAPSADALGALREALRAALSPEEVGGLEIAVGLAGDLEAKAVLLEKIEQLKQDDVQGFAAVALGLLGARESTEALRKLVSSSRYRPALLRDAAIGLGLLGDRAIAEDLVGMLREAKSLSSQAAITSALGFIGDRRALAPLIDLVRDGELVDTARAFGVVALGIIGDRHAYPWNTLLAADLNYAATTATLSNGAGTGVLDIL